MPHEGVEVEAKERRIEVAQMDEHHDPVDKGCDTAIQALQRAFSISRVTPRLRITSRSCTTASLELLLVTVGHPAAPA